MRRTPPFQSSVLALVCGCVDSAWQDQTDFEWLGEYVTIEGHDRDAAQACGRSLEATDDSVRAMLDFHGSNAMSPIRYHWLSTERWDQIGLAEDHRARHSRGEIISLELAHDHELAHAVSWGLHGRTCTPLLEEGLAVVLEDARPHWSESPDLGRAIEELLTFAGPFSYTDYERAGHFTAFLLETHGIAAIHELCERLAQVETPELAQWDAAFGAVLDQSLAELLAAYAGHPSCSHHQYRARLTDCAGDPDLVVGPTQEAELSFRFGCDEAEVIGERGGTMMRVVRVEVEVPGYYEVHVDDGSPVRQVVVIHEQCAACSEVPLTGRIEDGDIFGGQGCTWIESPAECGWQPLSGMHAFVFFLDEGLDRDVSMRIAPRVLVGQ